MPYTFLPYLRRGAINLADATSLHPQERLNIALDLAVVGDDNVAAAEHIHRKAQLMGPGDVTGLDPSSIVRTVPHRGVRDFEANYLAAIEFYDEDLPWRYTPALAQGNKLRPWLWLTVLEDSEFARRGISEGKLPMIEIFPDALKNALPNPDSTWAWAHVHLNRDLPFQANQQNEARTAVANTLDENPNIGCARLLCPRRLRPNTRYTAFVLPAFEKGRLAGIGQPEAAIDGAANTQAAWPQKDAVQGSLQFPVYFEWEFATATAGDFESLARLLRPFEAKDLDPDARLLDLQEPGWGLHYRSQKTGRLQPGAVALESALRIPGKPPTLAFGTDTPADSDFSKKMANLLNLGAETLVPQQGQPTASRKLNPFFGGNLDEDPIVTPPLYGSFYRANKKISSAALPLVWYNQLNINPVYRIAASQGAEVIRQNQEEYMDRAWEQLSQSTETRNMTLRWQFSLQVSQSFYQKRLKPILTAAAATDNQHFKHLSLMVPMHGTLQNTTQSIETSLRSARFGAIYTGVFAKLTRSSGPLMQRFKAKPQPTAFKLFFYTTPVVQPFSKSPLEAVVENALKVLDVPPLRTPPPALPPQIPGWQILGSILVQEGLPGLNACKNALNTFKSRLPHLFISTFPAPQPGNYVSSIAEQVRPGKTISARFRAQTTAAVAATDTIEVPRHLVEFQEPMYRALAERSQEFILPGLDRIPPNSVTIMEPNTAFIAAYLLGLNHEMAREFLWREFPAALNGTFFRQFWDVRDNPAAQTQPDAFKDILPVSAWGNTDLSDPKHQPGGMAGNLLVVVVRGDVLRKYPHTEVLMQKAKWSKIPGGGGKRKNRFFRESDFSNAANTRRPVFSARLDPDVTLLGFSLNKADAVGDLSPAKDKPGFYFALRERAGDAHFGLEVDANINDPSWPSLAEVAENQSINAESPKFKALPRYGPQADRIAGMLFQRPFVLYLHASRII